MSEPKHIMLINDLPGFGKVALAAMVPLLSGMGHYTYQLPTAIVSNTLDYGKFRIQPMTDYMRDTIKVWDELGIDPDCICTGFVLSVEQVELIRAYIESRSKDKERLILVDPIMADGGKLYNGIGEDRVEAMQKLVSISDVMVPNMTEASFLTGIRPGVEKGTWEEIVELIDALHEMSGKSVVITSVQLAEPKFTGTDAPEENRGEGQAEEETILHCVCGYDHHTREYFEVPFEYLPGRVAGSGDIFSAVMLGQLLKGVSLEKSVRKSVLVLHDLILENMSQAGTYKGIVIEKYWDILDL